MDQTVAPTPARKRPRKRPAKPGERIQIYLSPRNLREGAILKIWKSCRNDGERVQEVFRDILIAGIQVMVKEGRFPPNVMLIRDVAEAFGERQVVPGIPYPEVRFVEQTDPRYVLDPIGSRNGRHESHMGSRSVHGHLVAEPEAPPMVEAVPQAAQPILVTPPPVAADAPAPVEVVAQEPSEIMTLSGQGESDIVEEKAPPRPPGLRIRALMGGGTTG